MKNFCKLFDKLLFPEKNHHDFVETYNDDDRHFHKIDLLKVSFEREVERSWHLRSPRFFPYIFFRRFLLCRILRVHGWIAIEVEKTFNVKIYETRNGQLFKQEQLKILRQFSMSNAIYSYFLFCYLVIINKIFNKI